MALTRIKSSNIADETVVAADIADGSITDAKIQTGVSSSKLTGNLPAISGASLTNLTAANVTGALPAIDGSNLTGVSTDTSVLENNIAILAFKTQASNNLAKFNLIDQVVDEYYDTTGIDATASTNERIAGTGTAKYYDGATSVTPTTSSVGSIASTGTVDGDYTYYKWTTVASNHSFTTDTAQDFEYLVLAGGGGGGNDTGSYPGGGGGAGGYRTATGFAVAAGTISGITVGGGGAADTNGANSVFSTITSTGGGGGGTKNDAGTAGGSGGGGGGTATSTPTLPTGQGYIGGDGSYSGNYSGGGGGGAGQAGFDHDHGTYVGFGGYGLTSSIDGTSTQRGGGGGGGRSSSYNNALGGGAGGGGNGGNRQTSAAPQVGTANYGGGGGGGSYPSGANQTGAAGGSGIVIIRRLTQATGGGGNLTLQSVANTALSAPTTGDVVMLIENASGTATLNTDIKAYVSRNGGTGWDQATLVDKGTWGTNKKIVSANNVAFSNSASGTDMRYKITTHNQSVGSKETRVHATSLAWA